MVGGGSEIPLILGSPCVVAPPTMLKSRLAVTQYNNFKIIFCSHRMDVCIDVLVLDVMPFFEDCETMHDDVSDTKLYLVNCGPRLLIRNMEKLKVFILYLSLTE